MKAVRLRIPCAFMTYWCKVCQQLKPRKCRRDSSNDLCNTSSAAPRLYSEIEGALVDGYREFRITQSPPM